MEKITDEKTEESGENNSKGKDSHKTFTQEDIDQIVEDHKNGKISDEVKKLMDQYENEMGKYAVWRDQITEGFKTYLEGGKIYDRDKERISLYVSEETKEKWQKFIKEKNFSTISKLIRESVNNYVEEKTNAITNNSNLDNETISNLSHTLKEPLTTIKGFSQLLLEESKDELSMEVLSKIEKIFEQSKLLETKIRNILDNITRETSQYDILLIEDDLSTIDLLSTYFESKGYSFKAAINGTKGKEELRNAQPKLILLDIILPDISGYDICKMIKSDKNLKDIPVYLLTAIPGSEVQKKIDEIKADGYILKPFDFSEFDPLFKYLE